MISGTIKLRVIREVSLGLIKKTYFCQLSSIHVFIYFKVKVRMVMTPHQMVILKLSLAPPKRLKSKKIKTRNLRYSQSMSILISTAALWFLYYIDWSGRALLCFLRSLGECRLYSSLNRPLKFTWTEHTAKITLRLQ